MAPVSDLGSRAARLAVILFLVGLLTSRLSLIAHELVGHAAVAAVLGGDIADWHLFLFAGGYVDAERAEPWTRGEGLAISLGGIAVELVAGAALLLVARRLRRGSLRRFAVLAFGVIDLLHAGYYLSAGTFHGYGDGITLHRALGDHRPWLLAPGTVLLLGGALLAGRAALGALREWLAPVRARAQALIIAGGLAFAGASHAALTLAELRLARRQVYASTMQHESDRTADREVALFVTRERSRGAPPPPAEVERLRSELREKHRRFPFAQVLAVALAACFAAGGALHRSRAAATGRELAAPGWRAVGVLAAVTAGSVLLVAVLRFFEL
jgi:hypothetical protein